jgi:hypothetical protein
VLCTYMHWKLIKELVKEGIVAELINQQKTKDQNILTKMLNIHVW